MEIEELTDSGNQDETGRRACPAASLIDQANDGLRHSWSANHMGTAFGPVNVAIHAISASLKLGDPRTATETGEALDLTAMPTGLVGTHTQVNPRPSPCHARRGDAGTAPGPRLRLHP